MSWAINERHNMAIEDGLLPLAHVTHTYQISTTVQIVLINQSIHVPPPPTKKKIINSHSDNWETTQAHSLS